MDLGLPLMHVIVYARDGAAEPQSVNHRRGGTVAASSDG